MSDSEVTDPIVKPGEALSCSFCGKSQHEVHKLIAGPSVMICDECISLCNEIIAEEGLNTAKASPGEIFKYVLDQREAIKEIEERIQDALTGLAPTVSTGNYTSH